MAGAGWCTHPKRQLSSDVRILVRPAELACRNSWGVDFWEDKDGPVAETPVAAQPEPAAPSPVAPIQVSYEDEVTSVVSSDIHRSRTDEDLNDRVVEQTTMRPDEMNEVEDDRFDLLARGGRDSVGQARQRHLRRQRTNADLLPGDYGSDDDALPVTDASATETNEFVPDDYVEQEAPARNVRKDVAPEPAVPPQDDDVVLNEGVPSGSPRSRRLRRAREQTQRPKFEAAIAIDTDAAGPDMETTQTPPRTPDRFDSIPEITAEVELSLLRRPSSRPASSMPDSAAPALSQRSGENAYDRALKQAEAVKAEAIRAAARAEREQRLRHDRRPIVRPVTEEVPEPHLVAPQADPEPADLHIAPEDPAHGTPFEIAGQTQQDTFVVVPEPSDGDNRNALPEIHGLAEMDETDVHGALPAPRTSPTRRTEVRGSWWRGFFQSRDSRPAQRREPVWEDDYEDEAHLDVSADAWETSVADVWHEQYVDQGDLDGTARHTSKGAAPDEPEAEGSAALTDEYRVAESNHADSYEPLDLQLTHGMDAFRDRLFASADVDAREPGKATHIRASARRSPIVLRRSNEEEVTDDPSTPPVTERQQSHPVPASAPRTRWRAPVAGREDPESVHAAPGGDQVARQERWTEHLMSSPHLVPEALLNEPEDAWYEPEERAGFSIRDIVEQRTELLDMTIEIAPEVTRNCASCRSYRQSEQGERGWCTNNWAFTHRQMVNATDLACQSTIGCWWLPADEEVWLIEDEPGRGVTPRIDRLIAHLDPLKKAVGR